MERLEAKKINGRIYYYYSKWAWTDGKCRRVWQKYLGTLGNIAKAVDGGPAPLRAEIFQWGLPVALWKECCTAEIIKIVDNLCPKREQGLSVGEYLAIAAINRAVSPSSKRCMWKWFSQTALLRELPNASKSAIASQRFWDHMDKIKGDTALSIWSNILKGVVRREQVDLSSVSYDGTNFFTFIDTFNVRCDIAKRGKNKQGRNNLRQINYALFCCEDGQIPLYYDTYEGNRNDAKQFPLMLKKFQSFLDELTTEKQIIRKTTLIFDKGNNSVNNFSLLDSLGLDFVGSVKLDAHKELVQVANDDKIFKSPDSADNLKGTKFFRVKKNVYGRERILVVTFNQNLFNAQWLTLQNDISKSIQMLSSLQQKLEDRVNGVINGGKAPSVNSVKKQCEKFLHRQHLKRIIVVEITDRSIAPKIEYRIDADALYELSNTYLGKNILITSRENWDDIKIITAYRSQFLIEDVFKEMKDRSTGNWWPMLHWTDSKIKVHGLYCTIAVLIRSLMARRIRRTGLRISMKRILQELNEIREVINIYPRKRGKKTERRQSVLSKVSDIQGQLMSILQLNHNENNILG